MSNVRLPFLSPSACQLGALTEPATYSTMCLHTYIRTYYTYRKTPYIHARRRSLLTRPIRLSPTGDDDPETELQYHMAPDQTYRPAHPSGPMRYNTFKPHARCFTISRRVYRFVKPVVMSLIQSLTPPFYQVIHLSCILRACCTAVLSITTGSILPLHRPFRTLLNRGGHASNHRAGRDRGSSALTSRGRPHDPCLLSCYLRMPATSGLHELVACRPSTSKNVPLLRQHMP